MMTKKTLIFMFLVFHMNLALILFHPTFPLVMLGLKQMIKIQADKTQEFHSFLNMPIMIYLKIHYYQISPLMICMLIQIQVLIPMTVHLYLQVQSAIVMLRVKPIMLIM